MALFMGDAHICKAMYKEILEEKREEEEGPSMSRITTTNSKVSTAYLGHCD